MSIESPTLPEIFQHYFDTVLVKDPRARVACCARLRELALEDARIGGALGAIGGEHFNLSGGQLEALSGWPAPQLRLFASALGEAIGCPRGPDRPGPMPGPIFATKFNGAIRPEGPMIEIVLIGRDRLEITFGGEQIP